MFTKRLGRILHGVAVAAGGAAVASLMQILPVELPKEVAAFMVVGLQILQSIIGQKAFEKNWNGSPAELPAPDKPVRGY